MRRSDFVFAALMVCFVAVFVIIAALTRAVNDRDDELRDRAAECLDMGGAVMYDRYMKFDGCIVEPERDQS